MKNQRSIILSKCIIALLLSVGIIMDIGVMITGRYCVKVTESFMDYVYSSIITISTLSFSFIALLTGLLDKEYYGYKLREVMQFKESPINFKKYIICSLTIAGSATVLLMANFEINCVNTMVSILFIDIFLVGFTAVNIYMIITDEEKCYKLVVEHYKKKYVQKNIVHAYRDDGDRLFAALKKSIDATDINGKNEICGLIIELEKSVPKKIPEHEEFYDYIMDRLNRNVTGWVNSFGYNEMAVDIADLLENLANTPYVKIDLYVAPLKNIRFWTDQMFTEQDYMEQIKEIDFWDYYKNGKITNDEVEKILYYYFKYLLLNNICHDELKLSLIENFIHRLTSFHMGDKDADLTVDAKCFLRIFRDYVLTNNDIQERNNIFRVIIRELYYCEKNIFVDKEIYSNALSILAQAFYYGIICEQETLSQDFRENLHETLNIDVNTQTLSELKFFHLLENNIASIMKAIGRRIENADELESRFEYFPPFSIIKNVIWTEEFNVIFFFELFIVFSDQVGYYSPYNYFMDWENIDDRNKLSILTIMTRKYDLERAVFLEQFVNECIKLGELFDHPYNYSEEQQRNLYNHIREEQEKLKLEKIEEVEDVKIEWKEVNDKLFSLMNHDDVFGWSDVPISDIISIKYSTSPQISRREYYNSNKAASDLQSAILEAVNKYIKSVSNEVEVSFDEAGIDSLSTFLKNSTFDARNYPYTQDWGMLKYKNNTEFIELKELEDRVNIYNTKHIHEKMFFMFNKFKFTVKISKIEKIDLTEEECVEVIENSQCYNGMYNIDGVLMSKEKAVKSVQKIFVRERYAFKVYYGFGRKDVIRLKFVYKK